MRHQKKQWKGRAHDAHADAEFERALLGGDRPAREARDGRQDHKTRQLCEQVRRALLLALAGQCGDDVLRDVYVETVEPMGGAAQLMVRVVVPRRASLPMWEVLGRLNDRSARLRTLVAQSICRKCAPRLSFIVVPEAPEFLEGGGR